MTLIIRKDCNQLLSWTGSDGRSGLECVMALIGKSLENPDESAGLVMGDLVIHLLRKASDAVLPALPQLLQAMVGHMTTAKTATFTQVRYPLVLGSIYLPNYFPTRAL